LQCQLLVRRLWSSLRVSLNTGLDYWADNIYKYSFNVRSPDELLPPFGSAVLLPPSLHLCECCNSLINSSTAQDLYHTLSRGAPGAGMAAVIQHNTWWLNFTACITCVSEITLDADFSQLDNQARMWLDLWFHNYTSLCWSHEKKHKE